MTLWHGYIGIELLALTDPQRADVIAALRGLGPSSDPQPAHLMQFRASLDGSKAIFEALFNEDNLTIANVKQFIANAVSVDVSIIADRVQQTQYGPLVTYSVNSIDRMRFLAFGGVGGSTWEESRVACRDYIAANLVEWEPPEPM